MKPWGISAYVDTDNGDGLLATNMCHQYGNWLDTLAYLVECG